MRLVSLFVLVIGLAGCSGSVATEQRLREAEARVAEAEKKLAAIEQKSAPVEGTPVGGAPVGGAPVGGAPVGGAPAPLASGSTAPVAPKAPVVRVIPAGSAVVVRTTSLISTKGAKVNDAFVAHLEQPLMAGGVVIAPKGSAVNLVVTSADPGGRVKGKASLAVTVTSVTDAQGRVHRIATGPYGRVAKSGVKGDAVKTGVASGIGAAIGAIAGGGKGAAIGAGAGAGGGGAVVLATRGPAAEIAPETVLRFSLVRALRVQ